MTATAKSLCGRAAGDARMQSVAGKITARAIPRCRCAAWSSFVLLFAAGSSVDAAEHVVRTRRTEWIPAVLFVQPGDTVVWEGMRGHETALVDGMGPPGAVSWDSMLDAEGFRITLTEEGAYIYTCDIHINGGMVGAIVVGDDPPANLAAIDAALERVVVGRVFVERVIARLRRELARRN
jgi:plastocyanin